MDDLIRFDCPACGKRCKAFPKNIGKVAVCRCGQRMIVPTPPATVSEPPPQPQPIQFEQSSAADPFDLANRPMPVANSQTKPAESSPWESFQEPPEMPLAPRNRSGSNINPARTICAGFGASLLLLGLFLPMAFLPLGISVSFIDLPWKAVTVGFEVADRKDAFERFNQPSAPDIRKTKSNETKNNAETTGGSTLLTTLLVTSLLYPVLVGAAALLAFLLAFGSKRSAGTGALGVFCLAITLLYTTEILLVNTIKEARIVLMFISPGYGWAVLFVGSLLLCATFLIRSADSRARWH